MNKIFFAPLLVVASLTSLLSSCATNSKPTYQVGIAGLKITPAKVSITSDAGTRVTVRIDRFVTSAPGFSAQKAGKDCNARIKYGNGEPDDTLILNWDFTETSRIFTKTGTYWIVVTGDEDRKDNACLGEAKATLVVEEERADVMNNLGFAHAIGEGVPQSDTEAVNLYRKAAAKGHVMATYNLGFMHEHGRGVGQSFSEAFKLYQSAAKGGSYEAMRRLGQMYADGQGIPQDRTTGYAWAMLAESRAPDKQDKVESLQLVDQIGRTLSNKEIARAKKVFNRLSNTVAEYQAKQEKEARMADEQKAAREEQERKAAYQAAMLREEARLAAEQKKVEQEKQVNITAEQKKIEQAEQARLATERLGKAQLNNKNDSLMSSGQESHTNTTTPPQPQGASPMQKDMDDIKNILSIPFYLVGSVFNALKNETPKLLEDNVNSQLDRLTGQQGIELVQDAKAKLEWTGFDNGSNVNWYEAREICSNLNGETIRKSWRLPTTNQLRGLVDYSGTISTNCGWLEGKQLVCKVSPLFKLTGYTFWSSDSEGLLRKNRVLISLIDGQGYSADPKVFPANGLGRALCVRRYDGRP